MQKDWSKCERAKNSSKVCLSRAEQTRTVHVQRAIFSQNLKNVQTYG